MVATVMGYTNGQQTMYAIIPKVGPMELYGLPRRDQIKIRRL